MALIACPECGTQVSDSAAACTKCGHPIKGVSKSRATHIILGLLFGGLGFHNFYSSRYAIGWVRTLLFIITFALDGLGGFRTGFSAVFLVLSALAALVEIALVRTDATGALMQ